MLLDAAETVLGIFGFDRTLYCKPKDKKWWMALRRKQNERCTSRSWFEMIESTKRSLPPTGEIVAYHKEVAVVRVSDAYKMFISAS